MDLRALLEQTLPGMGYELVDVETSPGGRLVRVLHRQGTMVSTSRTAPASATI